MNTCDNPNMEASFISEVVGDRMKLGIKLSEKIWRYQSPDQSKCLQAEEIKVEVTNNVLILDLEKTLHFILHQYFHSLIEYGPAKERNVFDMKD